MSRGELAAAIRVAQQHCGGGPCVFKSWQSCVDVLVELSKIKPPWFNDEFARFVELVRACPRATDPAPASHPIVLVEGLDGTGKTTVTNLLQRKLNAHLVRTPDPTLNPVRQIMRHQPEEVARAFYSGANYLAAHQVANLRLSKLVVMDRWWASTCVMALAAHCTETGVPPAGSDIYQWPSDLLVPSCIVVLDVDENVRRMRAKQRGDEQAEEIALAANSAFRQAARTAYSRIEGCHTLVPPTSGVAVNSILDLLEEQRVIPLRSAQRLTPSELRELSEYGALQ